MANTERFRRQHRDLLVMAQTLLAACASHSIKSDGKLAWRSLTKFSALLSVHLSMERTVLYAHAGKQSEEFIRELAQKYTGASASFKLSFDGFLGRWPSEKSIDENPAAFLGEAAVIIQELQRHVTEEEKEMYPIVDGLRWISNSDNGANGGD